MTDASQGPRCIFEGTTREGLHIIVEEGLDTGLRISRIRTGMHNLEDARLADHGAYSDGTRCSIYDSPYHYSVRKSCKGAILRKDHRASTWMDHRASA